MLQLMIRLMVLVLVVLLCGCYSDHDADAYEAESYTSEADGLTYVTTDYVVLPSHERCYCKAFIRTVRHTPQGNKVLSWYCTETRPWEEVENKLGIDINYKLQMIDE